MNRPTGTDDGGTREGPRLPRRAQGQLESQVLTVLSSAGGPATAGWVQEHLDGDLAYTTVITILSRLYAKKAVTRTRQGRSYVWTPASDEAGLAALRMRRVLDGERDREAVLARFVSALSPGDEARLRELLSRAAEDPDEGRPGLDHGPDDPGDTDDSAAPEG
ncbi:MULTISPECIES: BlaI/MecI/CopY family transcriptional regulator [unclassified Streptomyces]|uniref:BlaI/MecI/CopY family transcriptional regulator n=1 Tax=unclassified Streptomyces TaxID=2593676 RepID=UPI0011C6F63C|nr:MULTISPECIES: BlaI/MecI/CopY family transcriptional regulator [unclassified Streptomyces]TXS17136.1 BlaI/MecI/CopY family transcriptional regulator [Streptomyces sp. wa22]WSR07679.1 BlaI/MecI/CopY family transcriptional regulator [Streptomyces sp. NBC_01208]WSR49583.1 BlaI/MecI/CopY family transcriptional regulator [Streptomyces sp. NBC_01201]